MTNAQVLPYSAGAHAGTDGAFTLMRFESGDDIVWLEAMRASLYLEHEAEVAPYAEALDHLKSAALSARDSLAFIDCVIKDLER
jgi:hypothetical protein